MSETFDSGTFCTELSEFDGDVIVVENPAALDNEETDQTAAITTCTMTEYPQNLQIPANRTLPMNRNEDSENNEASDKTSRFSVASIHVVEVFTTKRITKAVKCQLIFTLVFTICIITMLSVIPIVLYTTNPPPAGLQSIEVEAFQHLNFATCSVSTA